MVKSLIDVKPTVSYEEHRKNSVKQRKLTEMISQAPKRVQRYSILMSSQKEPYSISPSHQASKISNISTSYKKNRNQLAMTQMTNNTLHTRNMTMDRMNAT